MSTDTVFFRKYNGLHRARALALGAAGVGAGRLQRDRGATRSARTAGSGRYRALRSPSPERSFVGTIRPRIETDMGFRVPGKVAKRLVEVGQTVDVGQPLATLDEVDLKLQAEQAEAELQRRDRRAGAGRRRRNARQGSARQGLGHRRATGSGQGRRRRGAGAPQSRRALGRTHQEQLVLCDAGSRHPRRRHRDPDRARPGGGVRADRDPRRALCRKGSRGRDPGNAARPRQGRRRAASRCGRSPDKQYAAKLREVAPSADPATRTYLAKFSLPDAGDDVSLGMTATLTLSDPRDRARGAAAAVGAVQRGRRSLALRRRRQAARSR